MGLMKPATQGVGKNVIYLLITKDNDGNLSCEKSYIEIMTMLETDIFPILVRNFPKNTSYFYPQSLDFNNGASLIFSNIINMMNNIEMVSFKLDMNDILTMEETIIVQGK